MKSLFSVCKIFAFCFFIPCIITSCTKYITVNGNVKVPKKVCINITGDTLSNGHLTLIDDSAQDAYTFRVWPGQQIKWKIKVSKFHIKSIATKGNSKNAAGDIFKDPPRKQHVAANWIATVKDSVAGTKENGETNYDYSISWHIKHDSASFDPRIQIR